jgi:glyoxylase-like metal-dependent hydrolase (beta-lactamase superfamily II)
MSRAIDGKALYWVSAYLIDGLLIDTGCSYTAEELVAFFLNDYQIKMVVNTHFHEDHIGANSLIMNSLGAPVYAHQKSVPLINKVPALFPYQETVWGYPVPTEVEVLPKMIEISDYCFQVIETPGHSVGHAVLFEQDMGWCFSGDLFSREKPKFIRPEEDAGLMIDSMKQLLALDCERLILFTSVGRIVEDGKKALSECITYLEELAEAAQALSLRGYPVQDIVKEIFGGEHFFAAMTDGQFTTENLVRSVLAIK